MSRPDFALSRRRFVQAAALGVAPLILPSAVFGRGRVKPMGKIGLGFIGIGVMNRDHLTRFLKDDAVHVVGVCDVDRTRREDAKKRVDDAYGVSTGAGAGGCEMFEDHRDLCARKDIDAVCIAVPDHWHCACVLDAAREGKDIYCEKPLSLKLREARLMIDAVRKHERVFQTGSQQRTEYEGRFRKACEYVRSGRIGQLVSVNVGVGVSSVPCDLPEEPLEPGLDWDRWLGPAPKRPYNSILSPRGIHNHYPEWRKYREYSGGTFTDMGAHHFDIAQWGMGVDDSGPVEVHPPRDGKSQYGARLVYANGVQVFHGGPSGTTFVGSKGSILSPRGIHNHYPEWRKYREYSGGTFTDMGAHHFDIAQWGLGMDDSGPVEVHPPRDGKSQYGARLVYANGVQVFHGGPSGTTFVGSKGSIQVDRDRLTSTPESILQEPLKEQDVHLPTAPNHHANWIDCIASRKRCICDVEIGARTIACCHLLNLAYWHGRSLKWDPKAWTFVDDYEAKTWMDYERRAGYELPDF